MDLNYKKLGELLISKKLLTEQQVNDALAMQKQSPARLGEIATAMGWAKEYQIAECLALQYGYEMMDASKVKCTSDALATLSYPRALKNLTLPIKFEDSMLHCVIADPINVMAMDELRSAQKFPLSIWIAPSAELREAIIRCYVGDAPKPQLRKGQSRTKIDEQSDRLALLHALSYEMENDAPVGRRGW